MKLHDVLELILVLCKPLPPPTGLRPEILKLQEDEQKIGDFDACLNRLAGAKKATENIITKVKNVKNAKPKDLQESEKVGKAILQYLQGRIAEVTKLRQDLKHACTAIGDAGAKFAGEPGPKRVPELQDSYRKLCDLNTHLKKPLIEQEAKGMVALADEILTKLKTEQAPGGMPKAVLDLQGALQEDLHATARVALIV